MTFPGTLFFQTVKFLGLRKTRLLFLLKQTSYEDIYHFLAATAGYVLSGVRRLRAPEQGDFVLWWGRIGWSTKYYSFLLEYCPHSGVIHPEKKWPAWSTKYCYFNWSTNLSPWQGVWYEPSLNNRFEQVFFSSIFEQVFFRFEQIWTSLFLFNLKRWLFAPFKSFVIILLSVML